MVHPTSPIFQYKRLQKRSLLILQIIIKVKLSKICGVKETVFNERYYLLKRTLGGNKIKFHLLLDGKRLKKLLVYNCDIYE